MSVPVNEPVVVRVVLIQVGGALYLGFAILNGTARAALIGGIYNRPVALGNFLRFGVVAAVLVKVLIGGFRANQVFVGTALYSVYGIWFGLVLFTHPIRST